MSNSQPDHRSEDHASTANQLREWARLISNGRSQERQLLMKAADEIERLRAELKEATRCKHPTKRGTGSVSSDGKIVTSELWCDACGEKLT